MKKIGNLNSPTWGPVTALQTTYDGPTGPTAVVLQCEDGEPLATLSVNMYCPECSRDSRDLPADCFYVKQWSENEKLARDAIKSGLFIERTDLPPAESGWVTAPVWQIAGSAV